MVTTSESQSTKIGEIHEQYVVKSAKSGKLEWKIVFKISNLERVVVKENEKFLHSVYYLLRQQKSERFVTPGKGNTEERVERQKIFLPV